MAADPKMRKLYLDAFQANLALRFGALYRQFHLAPAQIARFEQLATDHADDQVTAEIAALQQGMSLDDPEFKALRQKDTAVFYAAISDEISPAVSARVIALDHIVQSQGLANEILTMRGPGSAPVTSEQVEELAQDLANASPAYQGGGNASTQDINWDAAYALAARTFSADQLEGFRVSAEHRAVSERLRQFSQQQLPSKDP